MNIAMEQTEEYVNGELKNRYGDAFIRGNNGTYALFSLCPLSLSLFLYIYLSPISLNAKPYLVVLYISSSASKQK
jgi:hypothetical protein